MGWGVCIIHMYTHTSPIAIIYGALHIKVIDEDWFVLQNKVLRVILHVKPRSSAEPLYKELDIMKFENINRYLVGNFMYRYICGLVPDTFSSFFIRNNDPLS